MCIQYTVSRRLQYCNCKVPCRLHLSFAPTEPRKLTKRQATDWAIARAWFGTDVQVGTGQHDIQSAGVARLSGNDLGESAKDNHQHPARATTPAGPREFGPIHERQFPLRIGVGGGWKTDHIAEHVLAKASTYKHEAHHFQFVGQPVVRGVGSSSNV
jgi:hypothetical protein